MKRVPWVLSIGMLCVSQGPQRNSLLAQEFRGVRSILSAEELQRLPTVAGRSTSVLHLSDDSVEFGRLGDGCFFDDGGAVALSTVPPRLIALQPGLAPQFRIVGTRGSCPGELQQPWSVECFARDSVVVLEPFRITIGALGGAAFRSSVINASEGMTWWEPIGRATVDDYVLRARPKPSLGASGTFRDTVELVVGDPRQRSVTDFKRLHRSAGGEYVRVHSGGTVTTAVLPLGRALLVAALEENVHVMDTGTNDLLVLSVRGETSRRVTFQVPGRAVTRDIIALYRARRLASARNPVERRLADLLWSHTSMPERAPLFDRVVAAREGGVWLREYVLEGDSAAMWLQLDAEYRPVLRWRLPTSTRLLAATQERALIVDSGDNGSVVAVDVIPSAPPRPAVRQ